MKDLEEKKKSAHTVSCYIWGISLALTTLSPLLYLLPTYSAPNNIAGFDLEFFPHEIFNSNRSLAVLAFGIKLTHG